MERSNEAQSVLSGTELNLADCWIRSRRFHHRRHDAIDPIDSTTANILYRLPGMSSVTGTLK
jgi:hypothetical protein